MRLIVGPRVEPEYRDKFVVEVEYTNGEIEVIDVFESVTEDLVDCIDYCTRFVDGEVSVYWYDILGVKFIVEVVDD